MKPFLSLNTLKFFFLLSTGIACSIAHAEEVVAVLSSDAAPYEEALNGLRETYSQPIVTIRLAREAFKLPRDGAIVVAFGGKAALEVASSSFQGPIIYGLAPGVKLHTQPRSGTLVKIHTSPAIALVLKRYKELQPSLHRLAVLWIGDSIADYFEQKEQLQTSFGVELISVRMKTLDDLPTQLRNLQGKTDAIWMPPDASLITPQSFAAVREFCRAQHIPFYVPSDGLVDKGATAAVYTSFHDLGRIAGSVAKKVDARDVTDSTVVFPDKASIAINVSAAAQSGLKIPTEILQKADKVVP